jgi:hypothetical protein
MSNTFQSSLVVRQASYGEWRMWITQEPLRFLHETRGLFEVPIGFWTDGASIPRALWALFPPFGRYAKAAVLHDHLLFQLKTKQTALTRREIDGIFLDACLACSTNPFRARLFHAAVRAYSLLTGPHT